MAKYYNLASLDSKIILFIIYMHYTVYSIYSKYFITECSVKKKIIYIKEIIGYVE